MLFMNCDSRKIKGFSDDRMRDGADVTTEGTFRFIHGWTWSWPSSRRSDGADILKSRFDDMRDGHPLLASRMSDPPRLGYGQKSPNPHAYENEACHLPRRCPSRLAWQSLGPDHMSCHCMSPQSANGRFPPHDRGSSLPVHPMERQRGPGGFGCTIRLRR